MADPRSANTREANTREANTREANTREEREDALVMARGYQAMGWAVTPLRRGEKAPMLTKWQKHGPLSEKELRKHFGKAWPDNLGIVLGAASGGLVEVDCDWPEAALVAGRLLPATGRISGRRGAPRSHWWYVIEGALPEYGQWAWNPAPQRSAGIPAGLRPVIQPSPQGRLEGGATDVSSRATIIELRGEDHQTMAPPSLHPSGERVVWDAAGEPGRVTADQLRAKVAEAAAAALLARHWPAEGTRDRAAMALAGMLARLGWDDARVDAFTEAVALAAGDEEWRRRGQGVATAAKLARKKAVTGATTLEGLLTGEGGQAVVRQARGWLRNVAEGSPPTPPTRVRSADLADLAVTSNEWEIWSVRASEVEERQLHWLWRGRIPLGAITMLDGDPGLGKSLLTLDLAARVSTGRQMPDETPGVKGGVVLLSAEDDPSVTIRPRLAAADADLTRISIVKGIRSKETKDGQVTERTFTIPGDCAPLEREMAEVGAVLVVIDPLMAYLDPSLNSWRDQDMRTALRPLSTLAEESGAAIIILRHLTKGGGANAVYRGGGSIGIIGAARAGLLVAKDPDNPEIERVVATAKSNLGPPMPSLRYRLEASDEGDEAPETLAAPTVVWLGTSEQTATSLLTLGTEDASALAQAKRYLQEALAHGPRPVQEVTDEATEQGHHERTLQRARAALHIRSRPGADGHRYLSFPSALPGSESHPLTTPPSPPSPPTSPALAVLADSIRGPAPDDCPPQVCPPQVCPATGDGAHVYAAQRDAKGHRVCIECGQGERSTPDVG